MEVVSAIPLILIDGSQGRASSIFSGNFIKSNQYINIIRSMYLDMTMDILLNRVFHLQLIILFVFPTCDFQVYLQMCMASSPYSIRPVSFQRDVSIA